MHQWKIDWMFVYGIEVWRWVFKLWNNLKKLLQVHVWGWDRWWMIISKSNITNDNKTNNRRKKLAKALIEYSRFVPALFVTTLVWAFLGVNNITTDIVAFFRHCVFFLFFFFFFIMYMFQCSSKYFQHFSLVKIT